MAPFEDHRQAEIVIDHRLARSLGEIHDLQPAMTERNGAAAMEAMGVRATRGEMVSDTFNGSQVGWLVIEA